ncbi:hypothetical protein HYX11_04055 [Candidatus Woesearchaeota archaeon]|nr:hypothetical protein [Candidatus Woesearchaeota archaeon]
MARKDIINFIKEKTIIFLLITVFCILIISSYIYVTYFIPTEIITLNYDFQIESPKNIGFNLDKDKLHFGITCPGCQEQRKITINNNENYKKKIKFYILVQNPSSADYFSISPPSGTIIKPQQKQEYIITLSIPQNASPIKDEGQIIIHYYQSIFN